jgi:hypothetical protein
MLMLVVVLVMVLVVLVLCWCWQESSQLLRNLRLNSRGMFNPSYSWELQAGGAWSWGLGDGSLEVGAWSCELGARSWEPGAWSLELRAGL